MTRAVQGLSVEKVSKQDVVLAATYGLSEWFEVVIAEGSISKGLIERAMDLQFVGENERTMLGSYLNRATDRSKRKYKKKRREALSIGEASDLYASFDTKTKAHYVRVPLDLYTAASTPSESQWPLEPPTPGTPGKRPRSRQLLAVEYLADRVVIHRPGD